MDLVYPSRVITEIELLNIIDSWLITPINKYDKNTKELKNISKIEKYFDNFNLIS